MQREQFFYVLVCVKEIIIKPSNVGLPFRDHKELTDEERSNRMSRASLMILDELEFDANVVTMPLVFAVLIAGFSQFLVG